MKSGIGVRPGRGTGRLVAAWVGRRVRSGRLWNRRVEFGLPFGEGHLYTCLLMSGRRFLVVWPRVSLRLLSAVVWDGPGQPSQGSWLVTVAVPIIGRSGLTGKRGRRPQTAKLAANETLRVEVEDKLAIRWSPQQIAGWLKHTYMCACSLHFFAVGIGCRCGSGRGGGRCGYRGGGCETLRRRPRSEGCSGLARRSA